MPMLYLANCTKQREIVYYRLDIKNNGVENDLRRFQPARSTPIIAPGRQVAIENRELHPDQIMSIVEQLSAYGLVEQSEIGRLPRAIVPYVFNVGAPVQAETIRVVDAHNTGVLRNDGQQRREAAAIAAQGALQSEASTINIPSATFEATIEQEDAPENDEKRVEEGYRIVDKESQIPDHQRSNRKRRA